MHRRLLILGLISSTFLYLFSRHSNTIIHTYNIHKTLASKESYITAAVGTFVDGQSFDGGIRELCERAKWQEGIIFSCSGVGSGDVADGGNANVDVVEIRNKVLGCLRFAIEGGGAFVLPTLFVRDPSTINKVMIEKDFSYLFDEAHFLHSLEVACPQLKVHGHLNDLYDLPSTNPAVKLPPQSLPKSPGETSFHPNVTLWRSAFDKFVKTIAPPYSAKHPIRVDLQLPPSPILWPISFDPSSFTKSFAHLVRMRPDTRALAAATLFQMSERFGWKLKPNDGFIPRAFAGYLFPSSFSETDKEQGQDKVAARIEIAKLAKIYLNQTHNAGLQVVYLAAKDAVLGDLYTSWAHKTVTNLTITTAASLLADSEPEFELYNELSSEQKAAVDHEVLLRSSLFGGAESRFEAWGIGLRRHRLSAKIQYLNPMQLDFEDGEGMAMGDEWSTVWAESTVSMQWRNWGRREVAQGLWP